MVLQTQQAYRLKVRVGGSEFEAEGSEDAVRAQFDLFLMAVKYTENGEKLGKNGHADANGTNDKINGEADDNSIHKQTWDRFYKLEGESDVSLKVLPTSKHQNVDSIMLLLYGYQVLRNTDTVGGTSLLAMAKKSGLLIDRIDRNIPAEYSRYISRGGSRRGARYALNNQGLKYAQELLDAEAER